VIALKDPRVIGMDDVRPEISEAFPTTAIMVGPKSLSGEFRLDCRVF
jgi:hypothetical protein